MTGFVYDTGALIAADRQDQRLLILQQWALGQHETPVVPVVVLAQAWRGGPQPRLSRLLKGCRILPDDEAVARMAGELCGVSGTSDVVDAIVVVTATLRDAAVVTSDPKDLGHLADSMGVKLRLHVL